MNGLIEKLKEYGANNIASYLNNEKHISDQVIKWVRNESGIDLYLSGSNGENLTQTQLNTLKDIDLKFGIKFTPKTQNYTNTFLTLIGPISGFIVVLFCILLDSYIIYTIMKAESIIKGIENLNAFVTLVTGYYHAKAGEIISYWFGASMGNQNNLDKIITTQNKQVTTNPQTTSTQAEEKLPEPLNQ